MKHGYESINEAKLSSLYLKTSPEIPLLLILLWASPFEMQMLLEETIC